MGKCFSTASVDLNHHRAGSLSEQPELGKGVADDLTQQVGANNTDFEYKNSLKDENITIVDRSNVYNSSQHHKVNDKKIKKYLKIEKRNDLKIKKCLLLGAGSSGKSTLFRQLKCIHGNGFELSEFLESQHVIRTNCVAGILILLKKSQELYDLDNNKYANCYIDLINNNNVIQHIKNVLKYQSETFEEIDDMSSSELSSLGQSISFLWNLPEIKTTYLNREYFSLIENMDFFLDKILNIFSSSYTVTQEDHLKCRIRTTGLIEATYMIKDVQFHIFDVGGQRNERKKWIQLFEGVTAVIFVAALNHYAAVLFEDECKNAMGESLQLFEEIANSKWFKKTEMILFLNKNDLFIERLKQQIKLNVFFNKKKYMPICTDPNWYEEYNGTEYTPKDDPNADREHLADVHQQCASFIQEQYNKRNKFQYKRIFIHITTATNRDNIQKVFWDVQNIVINSNLRKGGLV